MIGDYRIMHPKSGLRAVTLAAECPVCGEWIEFSPEETDAGEFAVPEEFPICEACDVVLDVPPVRIVPVERT